MPSEVKQKLDPTVLVIFGATGDLSRQRLIPALYRLFEEKLLPKNFNIIGFARSEFSHEQFREKITLSAKSAQWDKFTKKIYYLPGNFTNEADFARLSGLLQKLEGKSPTFVRPRRTTAGRHACANRLFYFATLPSHYHTISQALDKSGLLQECAVHKRQTRVVLEKPFGSDLVSAKKLDATLARYFDEHQIYRIDHYLGKETVQNLLTVRFANSIFEPVWNREHIDHVQISSMQETGIGSRGAFYEQTGAIRDITQNHLMQLLALTAMQQPADLSADSIRDERKRIIKEIRKPSQAELVKSLAIGQYLGYKKENNVSPKSRVETFAAVKLFVDNPRWEGVPFYLRTGKFASRKLTRISIHFKKPVRSLFSNQPLFPNILIFEIQPNEGLFLDITAKFPGFGVKLHPVTMELGYHSAFQGEFPEAYERLLLDFIEGDQRLFARGDEIEYSWKYIDEVENFIAKKRPKLSIYKPGTWGPKEADQMLAQDNRRWYN